MDDNRLYQLASEEAEKPDRSSAKNSKKPFRRLKEVTKDA